MTLIEKAYAKINLFLDVTGCREDGYHDIISIMHSVSLCDILTVTAEPADNTAITIVTDAKNLPTDENNLVFRAASAYLSRFDIKAEINISLEKHIPIGAGLGGGSSDAAATLRALNKIFKLATYKQLLELAAKIGSDVPFCLAGGIALCTGRGEQVIELSLNLKKIFVIAIGKERVSTPKAYAELDKLYGDYTNEEKGKENADYTKKIIDLLLGVDAPAPIYNIFEQVTNIDEIDKIKEIMTKNGAEYTLMSGSGPSVFGCFANCESAALTCEKLCRYGYTAFVANSVYIEDYI